MLGKMCIIPNRTWLESLLKVLNWNLPYMDETNMLYMTPKICIINRSICLENNIQNFYRYLLNVRFSQRFKIYNTFTRHIATSIIDRLFTNFTTVHVPTMIQNQTLVLTKRGWSGCLCAFINKILFSWRCIRHVFFIHLFFYIWNMMQRWFIGWTKFLHQGIFIFRIPFLKKYLKKTYKWRLFSFSQK